MSKKARKTINVLIKSGFHIKRTPKLIILTKNIKFFHQKKSKPFKTKFFYKIYFVINGCF